MNPQTLSPDFLFALAPWIAFAIAVIAMLKASIKFVPQNRAYVVERFGKYIGTKEAGLKFIVPIVDRVAYDRSLKEQAFDVPSQSAITNDNISLAVDGVLYVKVIDAKRASYGVEDYVFAVTQLAQTTMRSEIGKLSLDKTFEERDSLNTAIVSSINMAAEPWGVTVLRYEIKDITPPRSVLEAMERQMKAEREKRAAILESEGEKISAINIAEGDKRAKVLGAEAIKQEQILMAEGEAQAIMQVAKAKAHALKMVGDIAVTSEGQKAVQLDLATRAIEAKEAIAKESSIVLMDGKSSEAASVVTEAVAIVTAMNKSDAFNTSAGDAK